MLFYLLLRKCGATNGLQDMWHGLLQFLDKFGRNILENG